MTNVRKAPYQKRDNLVLLIGLIFVLSCWISKLQWRAFKMITTVNLRI